MALLINTLNILLLLYVIVKLIKKSIDSSLICYNIVSLYFINIPLFIDSFMIMHLGEWTWSRIVSTGFESWEIGFFEYLDKVSILSFIFNLFVNIPYLLVTPIRNNKFQFKTIQNIKSSTFPWWIYISISWIALILFMYNYGLSSIAFAGTGTWYSNSLGNPVINLATKILVGISPACVLKILTERNFVLGLITTIPIICIAVITHARSQFIAIAFFILYYFILKNNGKNFSLKKIIPLSILGFGLAISMSFFRVSSTEASYPISKDVSYSDMFYSIKHGDNLSTKGSNTTRLVLTGFYDYYVKEDITEKLADYKFFIGWGTLHPTIIGWGYIDLNTNIWILALFVSLFLSICDRLRHSVEYKYNLLLLASIFSFIAISIRGSVQFAYAQIIYPMIILSLFYLYTKILNTNPKTN